MLVPNGKDFLPPHHNNPLIYTYKCICGLQYIGRTNQRLDARIKHVTTKIRNGTVSPTDILRNTYGPSIGEHLINNRNCANSFSVDWFSVESKSHSLYHLKILETLYILTNKPALCKQREGLLGLNVINL